jgi:hypothetical protein
MNVKQGECYVCRGEKRGALVYLLGSLGVDGMLESVVGCVRLSERDGGENTMLRERQQRVHRMQRCCYRLLHHLKKNWQTVRGIVAHRFVAFGKGLKGLMLCSDKADVEQDKAGDVLHYCKHRGTFLPLSDDLQK